MRVVETLVGHSAFQSPPVQAPPSGAENSSATPSQTHHQSSSTPVHQAQPLPRPIAAQPRSGTSSPPALVPTTPQPHPVNIKIERQSPTPFQSSPVPASSPTTFHIMPTAESHPQSPQPTITSSSDSRSPRLGFSNSGVLTPPQFRTPQTVTTVSQNGIHSLGSSISAGTGTGKGGALYHPVPRYDTHVYCNSVTVVTPLGQPLSEDAWVVAWLKAAFEQIPGCSIEQEKMYRMYCTARKETSAVVPMEEFINCVK